MYRNMTVLNFKKTLDLRSIKDAGKKPISN